MQIDFHDETHNLSSNIRVHRFRYNSLCFFDSAITQEHIDYISSSYQSIVFFFIHHKTLSPSANTSFRIPQPVSSTSTYTSPILRLPPPPPPLQNPPNTPSLLPSQPPPPRLPPHCQQARTSHIPTLRKHHLRRLPRALFVSPAVVD